jgi:Protein of unknown function (DUF3579)
MRGDPSTIDLQVFYKIQYLCTAASGRVQPCGPDETPPRMVSNDAKEVFIQGITRDGKTFRPSDWAERLAGVMSQFRPGGAQPGSHLSYSPWCVPTVINGVRCVVVNRELRDMEPMAWDFVLHFARDNDLQVAEACLIPDAAKT